MSATLAELLALLPDNTTGDIGADDMRTVTTELYGHVPTGGTTGQVLTKDTATDLDVSWQTPPGGGGGLSAVTTADTTTVDFSGNGTAGTPLTATVLPGAIPVNTLGAATGDLNMNSFKIGAVLNPTFGTDAANKNYVDGVLYSLAWKDSVRVSTTANITLSGLQAIDGVTVVANDRVLVKNQTTASSNGIYLAASGAWTRTVDCDAAAEIEGMVVVVREGTTQADTAWLCTTDSPITVGTTGLTFTQFGAGGGGGGSVATDTIFDAKGDLAVGTGPDAAARLAVGANGTVVMADSTQATGLKFGVLNTLAEGTDIQINTVSNITTIGVLGSSSQKWGHADYDVLTADDAGRLNTTTQTAVSGLSLSMVANAVYVFESVIHYTATTVADIKASYQTTATGTTWTMRTTGYDTSLVWIVNSRAETDQLYRYGGNGATVQSFDTRGIIRTAGTAGTLDFWYAQNTQENVTATIVKAGSYMRLQRLL